MSTMFCGAIPVLSGPIEVPATGTSVSKPPASVSKSKNISNSSEQDGGADKVAESSSHPPMSEILNVKYAPAYAKSFFSAVTYSYTHTEATDGEQDVSVLLDQSTRRLASP